MSLLLPECHESGISADQEERIRATVAKLAPTFILNAGQVPSPARFYARGAGYGFYFTPAAVNMAFSERPAGPPGVRRLHQHFRPDEARSETDWPGRGLALSLRFIGANPAVTIEGRRAEPGSVNFFIGGDPAKWRSDLRSYGEIVYRELWPGIDLVFRKTSGVLKYEYTVQPGADPNSIRLAYDGADDLALDAGGNLLIHTPWGVLTEQRPASYRPDGGRRLPVATEFTLDRSPDGASVFGFTAGNGYAPACPLIIDPGLVYSTYLGGSSFEMGYDIAIDATGHAYVTGYTESPDFPTTTGAYQTTFPGNDDAFAIKLNPGGTELVYSTYLGGSYYDYGTGIAVDAAGHAYVFGGSYSADFPTTPHAFQPTLKGFTNAFVAKLNPAGTELVYSTYLGGSYSDIGWDNAIDATGHAYITGWTDSPDFPVTADAFQTTYSGGEWYGDAFVTKLNPAGSALVYSTYLGGSGDDHGSGIAVDAAGHAYVTGWTASADFPATPGAYQTTHKGGTDAFVTKLNPAGSALVYSTYLGGSGDDYGNGITVDAAGHAYVTGGTYSDNFPATLDSFQAIYGGNRDAFVTKLNPIGSALVYSTYLGGSGDDYGNGIAVDAAGRAYVTGGTYSADFPVAAGAVQTTYGGSGDVFVSKLNPSGSSLAYSTYLGGSDWDEGWGIVVNVTGHAYLTGWTGYEDFPITADAFQPIYGGGSGDAFIAKLSTIGGECGSIISDPACRLNLGLDTPNGPDNPVPDPACHAVCIREVTMIASAEVHRSLPYPPAGRCRLGPGISLPPLAPNRQCSLFITCAGEVLGPDCANVTATVGLLAACVAASGSVVAVPLTIVLNFGTFYDFPTCARLYYSDVRRRLREIDGSCLLIQLKAAVNGDGSAILIDGKVVDKLWKYENLWFAGLRPYGLDQEQRDQGFISLTVGSAFADLNSGDCDLSVVIWCR